MAHGPTSRPSERYSALALVLVLHAIALLLLLSQRGSPPEAVPKPGLLKVISLNAEAPREAPPPPPVLPSKMVQEIKTEMQLALSDNLQSDSAAAPSGGCVALEQVKAAIMGDPAALSSVIQAPPETRSIAEAIVIWNQNWVAAASSGDAPLGPARTAVERSLAAMPDDCLDEEIAGPRLVPFAAGPGTIFLVFGSASWSWRDVASPTEPARDSDERGSAATAGSLEALFNAFQRN